ncbi:ABC transporter substrate-binding protein [Mycolicibacterium mageritense]|uniref:ABC transporter substrate-binding protein n=1 Tax=Mycolicibacterium mageritense TaxID=53462 RepID=UPI0011DA2DCA|nr:ABC transporter substrate-binding protein [Mycolicibacterium mageritense]TXI65918.1 MAG: amino acid ABC transporter substrate-binding protein [Mycolicibacterium mageritense]
MSHNVPQSDTAAIVIGLVASLTGSNYMGAENRDGAELAVQQINDAGGLLTGRRVELKTVDDRSLPQGAVDAYLGLTDNGVTAVVGTSFSNASLAVLPYTDERKVVYVSTGAAHTQVDPVRPYVFMTPPTGRLVAVQLLRYLRDQGLTRIGVAFDSDSVFNRVAWVQQETMLSQFGIDAVAVESFEVDTEDFTPTVISIAQSGAQALMAWVTGPPAIGLALAYRAARLNIPMVAGLGAASPAFVDAVGPGADGIIVATSLVSVRSDLPPSPIRTAISALSDPFERRHGRPPSQFAVDGYTAVQLIAAAVESAGDDDAHAVQRAMDSLRCLTPEGEYHFSPANHSGLDANDVAVAVIRDRQFRLTPWSYDKLCQHLAC